jgi:hypothetical protein
MHCQVSGRLQAALCDMLARQLAYCDWLLQRPATGAPVWRCAWLNAQHPLPPSNGTAPQQHAGCCPTSATSRSRQAPAGSSQRPGTCCITAATRKPTLYLFHAPAPGKHAHTHKNTPTSPPPARPPPTKPTHAPASSPLLPPAAGSAAALPGSGAAKAPPHHSNHECPCRANPSLHSPHAGERPRLRYMGLRPLRASQVAASKLLSAQPPCTMRPRT